MTALAPKLRGEAFEAIDGTDSDGLAEAIAQGLALAQKAIPARFLYDERGSHLFEEITGLEEYYPTRTEVGIFADHGAEIAALLPNVRVLVEFGSGSSRKIRSLLAAMQGLKTYAPIDISETMLLKEAAELSSDYPRLEVVPVHADFTSEVELPETVSRLNRLAFFPGSTIGNFLPHEALRCLQRMRRIIGTGGYLLIGVDRKKDRGMLLRAYDDGQGVTAAFNLNLLARVNRELGADFDLDAFAHEVRYDEDRGRIEMHLRSLKAQKVTIAGTAYAFAEGETIHTENSHKYSVPEFHLLARAAGFEPVRCWSDENELFSVYLLAHAQAG